MLALSETTSRGDLASATCIRMGPPRGSRPRGTGATTTGGRDRPRGGRGARGLLIDASRIRVIIRG